MSRDFVTHFVDLDDLDQEGGDILCPNPDCEGQFDDFRLVAVHGEAVELNADCTHCRNKLYICHEQPSSMAVNVPKDQREKSSPDFA